MNMKIKFILTGFLIICVVFAANAQKLSLDDAIKAAFQNKTQLKTDRIAEEIAQSQIREATLKRYPQLNATGDMRANVIRQTTIIPEGAFGAGTPERKVKFGTIFNPTLSVDASYALYDKKTQFDIQQANLNYELSQLTAEVDKENIAIAVIKSYLNVLINEERKAQIESDITRFKQDVKEMQVKVKSGLQLEIEEKRLKNSIQNAELELQKQMESIRISKEVLRFNTGINDKSPLELTDNLATLQSRWAGEKYGNLSLQTLPAYRQQTLSINIAENQLERQRAKLLPTVNVYGFGALQSFGNDYTFLTTWFPVSYLGVRVNWGFNTLWENKTLLPQHQLQITQLRSQLLEWEENTRIAIAQAESLKKQAQDEVMIQQNNVAFANENLAFLRKRLASDLITYKEVADAEMASENARIQSLIAQYNYIMASYEWLKARGEIVRE